MPSTVTAAAGFVVSNWRPYVRNTLVGFCSIELPSGMVIHECAFHRKADDRWLSLPAGKFEKSDGVTTWVPLVEFSSKEAKRRFQEQALAAIDRFLGGRQ
jgi:hypothetical protein